MTATGLTQQLMEVMEAAPTKALGWILEQHCELRWTEATLDVYFCGNHHMAHDLLHEDETIEVLRTLVCQVMGRPYAVRVIDAFDGTGIPPQTVEVPRPVLDGPAEIFAPLPVTTVPPLPALQPPADAHNQGQVIAESAPLVVWNELRFRSQSEMRIAIALDRKGVLFLPNCKARLGMERRYTREADFLVCHRGRWGMLEVDGEPYHPVSRTVEDHRRDRLFKEHGIRLVEHFDATECYEHPDRVVMQFLELLEQVSL